MFRLHYCARFRCKDKDFGEDGVGIDWIPRAMKPQTAAICHWGKIIIIRLARLSMHLWEFSVIFLTVKSSSCNHVNNVLVDLTCVSLEYSQDKMSHINSHYHFEAIEHTSMFLGGH